MTYAPPPGMAQPKKGTNPLVWIFVALGAFCCIAIIAFGGMTMAVMNQTKNIVPCMFTFKGLQVSLDEYVKEHGVYPPSEDWQDELAPFYKKHQESLESKMSDAPGFMKEWGKIADIDKELGCNTQGSPKTFISYNPDVAGKKFSEIADPKETVVLFETTASGRNLSAKYEPLPFNESPQMMGSNRGWSILNAEGDMQSVDGTGKRSEIDFNSDF